MMRIQFFTTSLHSAQQERLVRLQKDFKALPQSAFEGADREEFCERMASKYRFRPSPVISKDGIERDEPVFQQDNPSASITVYIPFIGNAEDFQYFYTTTPIPLPVYEVENGFLKKTYQFDKRHVDRLDKQVEEEIKSLDIFFDETRTMIEPFSKTFIDSARQYFDERVREINANKESAAKITASKFAVRKRNDGAEKIIVPVARKPIAVPAGAPATKASSVQEYVLEVLEYDDILSTISSMAKVMERTPSVFAEMNEEPLRTILLVALNGIYEGQATGETFNGRGKTDILIRRGDRNVFIAECLMWKGSKYLQGKMDDQIFRYAMWRDSKVALIVFNRGGKFSRVVESMKETVAAHSQCVGETDWKHESGARYIFRRHDDRQRQFTLTALAFDVPSGNQGDDAAS